MINEYVTSTTLFVTLISFIPLASSDSVLIPRRLWPALPESISSGRCNLSVEKSPSSGIIDIGIEQSFRSN